MEYFLGFNNLNYETQEEILTELKKRLMEKLEQEAKEKEKTLKQLMWTEYDLDWDIENQADKERFFELSLDEFLEDQAKDIINRTFKHLSVYFEIL
jgi:hypothetical protein